MSISTFSRWAATVLVPLLLAVPVRADIPDLAISKQVNSANETIEAGELIHYVTSLRFTGAESQAFSIVEVIREPLHVRGTAELIVTSGQTSNRRVTVETRRSSDGGNETVVRWRGTLAAGETRIQLSIPVRAEVVCRPSQTRAQRQSMAVITLLDGSGLRTSASRDYTVECPPMASIDDIEVELTVEFPESNDDAEPNDLRVSDSHDRFANQAILHATLTNHGDVPAAIGMLMGLRPAASEPPGDEARYAPILLRPDETRTLQIWTDMRPYTDISSPLKTRGEDEQVDVVALEAEIRYLLLSPLQARQESVRPAPTDEIHTVGRPVRLRAWDLGDAPASTNSFDTAMEAYPGVQAEFPTVFDVARGDAPGPAHARPRLLHLGRSFSLEADADRGRAANIQPPRNRADLDEFDDSTQPSSWNLQHCRSTTVDVQVFISREAAAWFDLQGQVAYLNAWLDFDRDGQWTRVLTCPNGRALEHIIIDHAVDVAALGPGYHNLQVPTGRIYWPADQAHEPAWVRLTLSEEPSVKTATSGSVEYGDGRGPGRAWQFGETEDFLLKPSGAVGAGPDLQVRLSGSSRAQIRADNERSTDRGIDRTWIMEYTNRGSERALSVERIFEFPDFVSAEQIAAGATFGLVKPRRDAQTIYYRLRPDQYSIQDNRVHFEPIDLDPGEQGSLLMWYVPDMDSDSSGMAIEWTVTASAITTGDINPDNRTVSFTEVSGLDVLEHWPEKSRIAARSPNSPFWVPRGTTNSKTLAFSGFIPTGETAVYVNADGKYYEATIAEKGYFNLWLQIIEASSEGNDVGAMPGLHFPLAFHSRNLAPGVYVEEISTLPASLWELELTNLPDAHYRIAVGDPRACDDSIAGLIGDEWALVGDEWELVGDEWEWISRPGNRSGASLSSCALFTVDSSLPIDPISLGFVEVPAGNAQTVVIDDDGRPAIQGKVILPDTLGFSRGDWSLRLPRSAEDTDYVAVFALKPALNNPQPRLTDRYGDQQRQFEAFETSVPAFFQTETFFFDEADALFGSRAGDEAEIRDLVIELAIGDMDLAFAGRPDVARPGRVWKAPAGIEASGQQDPSDVRIDLLVGVPMKGEMLFVPFNGKPYGQPDHQVIPQAPSGAHEFHISVPRGIYQLVVQADGYQTHRSPPFLASGPIRREIVLQPQSLRTPAHVIMIEEQGMSPAFTQIHPGETVRVVNVGRRALILGVDEFQQEQTYSIFGGERESDQPPQWNSGQLKPGDAVDLVVSDQEGPFVIFDLTSPGTFSDLQIVQPGDQIFRDRFAP